MSGIPAGKPAIEIIRLCYQADRSPLMLGRHGVGKSDIIAAAAKEIGIDFICRDLSLMEPPDLIGMPKIIGGRTTFAPPAFLPTGGNGLLVFEELNRCDAYMRAPCLQLLTSRSLNDYRLPPGWLPVAAINPSDDGYEVHELDPALLSRFVQIPVVPNTQEWLLWGTTNEIHDSVIKYVTSDSKVFDTPTSNPRAWKYVSDLVYAAERNHFSRDSLRQAIAGLVGDSRAAAFMKILKGTVMPLTPDKILRHYKKYRNSIREWLQSGRLDLVRYSLHTLKVHLQPKAAFSSILASPNQATNLSDFFEDLPGDLRQDALQFLADRNYVLPQSKTQRAS